MTHVSLLVMTVWVNAGLLLLAGLANLSNFRGVRGLYRDLDIPEIFSRVLGAVQVLAALFLVSPGMRLYGGLIAAPILFGAVIMLLSQRHYTTAAPVMAMMASLVIAILAAVPAHPHLTAI
jgi:hypothetical protein